MKQSALIFGAIVFGLLFPAGHQLTFLIKYNLIVMLFLAFLDIKFSLDIFSRKHIYISIANIVLPILFYFLFRPLGHTWALTAFIICVPPTAAAAPVLAKFMKTDVSFVTASVILTSPLVALFIPLILPQLTFIDQPITVMQVLIPVFTVVGLPIVMSSTVKISSSLTHKILRWKIVAFYLFLLNVWIACGNAVHFLKNEGSGYISDLPLTLSITIILCLILFWLGEKMVSRKIRLAGSLALGRKNTMFGLWLALTFLNPLIAMGPVCYILAQNSYNSWQILTVEKKGKTELRE